MNFGCIGGPAGTRGACGMGDYGVAGNFPSWAPHLANPRTYTEYQTWRNARNEVNPLHIPGKYDVQEVIRGEHQVGLIELFNGRPFAWIYQDTSTFIAQIDRSVIAPPAHRPIPGVRGYGAMITDPPVEGWVLRSFTGSQVFPDMAAAEAASDAVLQELIASGKVVTDAYQVAQINILQAPGGYAVQVEYWVAPEFAEKKKLIWPWVVGGVALLGVTVGGIAWYATKGKRRRRARRR